MLPPRSYVPDGDDQLDEGDDHLEPLTLPLEAPRRAIPTEREPAHQPRVIVIELA